jgi:rhodanese-related sulfurtransferase
MIHEFIKNFQLSDMSKVKIQSEAFIEKFNNKEAILVDVREEFETNLISINFSTNLPLSKMYEEYKNLPKDKLIVTICPHKNRANIGALFLNSNGLNAKFLDENLSEFVERFMGPKAKSLKV